MHCKSNFQLLKFSLKWASSRENLTLLHANNEGADQPAHSHNLISTSFIRLLESVISHSATWEISIL